MKLINIDPILKQMAEEELSKKELRRLIRNAEEYEAVFCSECILNENGQCLLMDYMFVKPGDFCSFGRRRPE